jgi:acyl-CoA reductase-like NAD-dependent aldehyde dehydrogenase
MAAAARNLCPVTLELGGKAPAMVCEDFSPLRTAAERILFVKCLNAGQICTTVDHVFLPRAQGGGVRAELAQQIVPQRYPRWNRPTTPSIIDERAVRSPRGARWTRRGARRHAGEPAARPGRDDAPRARSRRTWCSTRRTTAS